MCAGRTGSAHEGSVLGQHPRRQMGLGTGGLEREPVVLECPRGLGVGQHPRCQRGLALVGREC